MSLSQYKINVINKTQQSVVMWTFLDAPESNIKSEVFANSDAFQTVPPSVPGLANSFTIPLQYWVKAGASNAAVGLDILIDSSVSHKTALQQQWSTVYTLARGERTGPTMANSNEPPLPGADEVQILTNPFNKAEEKLFSWYGSMTWGVQSKNGFLGVSWSPDANQIYRIKPKVKFFVATGTYSSDTLADIAGISRTSANISEANFDGNLECTVTLKADRTWSVEPGPPVSLRAAAEAQFRRDVMQNLVNAHVQLASAHRGLIELTHLETMASSLPVLPSTKDSLFGPEERISNGVHVDSKAVLVESTDASDPQDDVAVDIITGTLTLSAAIGIGFGFFLASAITLRITRTHADGVTFDFEYDGAAGRAAIMEAFRWGQEIMVLRNA